MPMAGNTDHGNSDATKTFSVRHVDTTVREHQQKIERSAA